MTVTIEQQIRQTPQVGSAPYRQVHAHSTGNPKSTAQNEADYMGRKDLDSGFYTHVVGNGRVIQTAAVGRGAWDVGGGWNAETYAAVELIESHATQEEFERDYRIYVNLLRQLAQQAGLPTTLDKGSTGILTHAYCTANQPDNRSDHVDPYPYLARRGISKEQFAHDLAQGFAVVSQSNIKTTQSTEEEEMKNFVVRSKSGKQGYVGVVNGAVFGIGAIDTVSQLKAAGAVELVLDDGDFIRFLESQQFDDKKLVASIDELKKSLLLRSSSSNPAA